MKSSHLQKINNYYNANLPIKTLSGSIKSFIAVPSAKNSGFERTWRKIILINMRICATKSLYTNN